MTSRCPRALRSILGALLLLAGGGCGTFPLSLYVDEAVFDELERTSLRTDVSEAEIAAGMADRLGHVGERVPLLAEEYHRVDRSGVGPFLPPEVDDPSSPAVAGLASGDVILAKNSKAQSLASTLVLVEFTFYDHLGLLAIEDGGVFVYESWPKVDLFCRAPDFVSRYRGRVRRLPLSEFLERYETVELVRFPDPDRNLAALAAARESVTRDIEYDPYHDPNGPELSCSEYLEMLLVEGGGYAWRFPRRAVGRNLAIDRTSRMIGFRTPDYIVPDVFMDFPGTRPVGVISVHSSSSEVLAIHEAFAVLHARDRPDAPAGNHFTVHPWHFLVYRDETLAFLEWSKAYFRDHPSSDPRAIRGVVEEIYEICIRPKRR